MPLDTDTIDAPQTHEECITFVEAFAKVNIEVLRQNIAAPMQKASAAAYSVQPDWKSSAKLAESGIGDLAIDSAVSNGKRYLHIDIAMSSDGADATRLFLRLTGLSDKQQKMVFPILYGRNRLDRSVVSSEVRKLNKWLDWVREEGFDPELFIQHQNSIAIHGRTQNLTGQIGAIGASIAFLDALRERSPKCVVDMVGSEPPQSPELRSPSALFRWKETLAGGGPVNTILLKNGRAIVFASSKDATIFTPLGTPFVSAIDALTKFNAVKNDAEARKQILHEFCVGEVKTATDPANLHERMGLASRETQTELRSDRFLMMSLLTKDFLEGGVQRRVMNNRDVKRFSQIFNLHHCWGWDGGRSRHQEHWDFFVDKVAVWCGV